MRADRLVGPGAGSEKYDLITALAVMGFSGSQGFQTSMMRLIALITARYNWSRDEVTIGQKELASLWHVDERTAKREVKRLLDCGLLTIKRPGVRGRVASYNLNMSRIYSESEARWEAVGRDYSARMDGKIRAAAPNVVNVDFRGPPLSKRSSAELSEWDQVGIILEQDDPASYASWFSKIALERQDGRTLILRAPSNFVGSYVSSKLAEKLHRALKLVFNETMEFRFKS